jgi:inner membrane protein
MKGTTHILGGIAAAVVIESQFDILIQEPLIYYSAAVAGALIPDICHPKSMIGRRLPIFSRAFSRIFGHRSFSHSLLFMVLLFIITEQFHFAGAASIQAGLLIGVASHILLDGMTAQGVKLLYPIKMNIRTPLYVRTGSKIGESIVIVLLISVTIFALFNT